MGWKQEQEREVLQRKLSYLYGNEMADCNEQTQYNVREAPGSEKLSQ